MTWYDTSTEWSKHNFIIGLLTHCSGKLIKTLHDFIQNNRFDTKDSQGIILFDLELLCSQRDTNGVLGEAHQVGCTFKRSIVKM